MITITTSFKERSILFVTDGYLVHSRILNKAFKEVPVSTIIHQFILLNLSISGEVFKSWIGHFRVPPGLCFRTRVGAQPLIWKSFFILMQIKLIFTRKVVHLASFWKWGFLELASGLFAPCKGPQDIFRSWIPCSRFRIPSTSFQSLSMELGFWIAIFSWIPVSCGCIPDSQAEYSRFHMQNFLGFCILRTADVSPRSSPLRDVLRGGRSATQRQKFHTEDVSQCLHNKSGSHGVPNANLFNVYVSPGRFW